MSEKIYFKFFFGFFILVLVIGGLFFWSREVRKQREGEVMIKGEEEEDFLDSPPLQEVLPSETTLLPRPSPTVELKEFELSTNGRIGQFAADWDWALMRNQDGRLAETKLEIEIDPEREIREAILVFSPIYSGEGEGEYEVYINDRKQVKEKDEKHNFSSWWVGDEAILGKKIREEGFRCLGREEVQAWEVTDLVETKRGGEYFVAFLNKTKAGITVEDVYLRVIYKD